MINDVAADSLTYMAVGEGAILLRFNSRLSSDFADNSRQCQHLARCLLKNEHRPKWLIDVVPSYDTVMVHFDGFDADQHDVFRWVRSNISPPDSNADHKTLTLPVCYDLDRENDIPRISAHTGLSRDAVVSAHLSGQYHVYAIGFAPGFAYMGFVDECLATPRLSKPRTHVPQGAVAIADRQTAIYPSASPGGWNIIGYCPITLVDVQRASPSPFEVGQSVKFSRIDTSEFEQLSGKSWYDIDG